MTTEKVIEWYENLPDDERMKLNLKFGNEGVPNRETKFYKWLKLKHNDKR